MATKELQAGDQDELLANGSLIDPTISAHPQAYYEAMRARDPVHFDEKLGSWLISRYEDICAVQRDPITFSVEHGYKHQYAQGFQDEFRQILERDGGGFFPDAIMSDPPYHTRVRRLMESAFTAHRVKQLEPHIVDVVADVIDSFAGKGQADAVKDFAVPITIRVICAQLGISHYNADNIQRWSHAVTQQIGRMQSREEMLRHAEEICDLQNFLIAEIRDREANPTEDMISDLVHARTDDAEGPTLSFTEVVSLVRAIMIAGNETTATAMANLVYILATQPRVVDLLQESVDDDRLMSRFVEELLRVEPPVRALSRMTTKDVDIGGTRVPSGAHLLLVYASGTDDASVFPDPREFDITRPNLGRHVSFGGGPHRCIGLSLARMEVRVAARELIRRLGDIRLAIAPEEIRYLPTVATHSIDSLPFTFVRRAAG